MRSFPKVIAYPLSVALLSLMISCSAENSTTSTTVSSLPQKEFEARMAEPNTIVLDVRTPEEYNQKHLDNAVNLDYQSAGFEKELDKLDKSKTYLVYCQAGVRSSDAAAIMAKKGFKVETLAGGVEDWVGSSQNEPAPQIQPAAVTGEPAAEAIKILQAGDNFNELVSGTKPVLVDFTATWCGPCKMMKPALRTTAEKLTDKMQVLEVDIDQHPNLAQQYRVNEIPTLIMFKQGKSTWTQTGSIPDQTMLEAEIRKHL